MNQKKEHRNTFFNFRITYSEMEQIREVARKLNYVSFAEFIRAAIREKANREVKDAR